MKQNRSYSFIHSSFSLLMAIAGFLGLSSFLNLKEEDEKQKESSVHNFILYFDFFYALFRQLRFGFILMIFILLFIEEEED